MEIVLYAGIFLIGYWVGREMAFRKARLMLLETIAAIAAIENKTEA